MPDVYNISAARGRVIGQGLMGMGQGVSTGLERHRRAKGEKERAKKEEERYKFTKTLSILNVYMKMAEDLTPEDRMKLYTGAFMPMLAKAGGLPEGIKEEDMSQFIGSLAVHSKEAVQGAREDNEKLIDLVNDGKYKEAEKFLAGMTVEYGRLPGAKTFLDYGKTLLKGEKAYARSKAGKEEERKYETTKGIKKGVLAGELQRVPPGQKGVFTGRPVVDYGERGGLVAGLSETQKTERAAKKAGAIVKAKEKPREVIFTHKGTGLQKKVIEGTPQYTDLKEDINYVEGTYPASRFKAKKAKGPKEPTPVNWTTATKELKGRFGKQDPIGNMILTPELAGMHRIAQKRLVALKKDGKVGPLEAINMAEDFARKAEQKYWQYIDSIKDRPDRIERKKQIDGKFRRMHNYLPKIRPLR